jgi:hypothetical protein
MLIGQLPKPYLIFYPLTAVANGFLLDVRHDPGGTCRTTEKINNNLDIIW